MGKAESKRSYTNLADKAGIWWGILGPNGILSFLMSVLLAFFEPVAKLGWAAVALAGIFSAVFICLLLALAFATAAWAWRKFKPYEAGDDAYGASGLGFPQTSAPDFEAVNTKIEELTERFEQIEYCIRGLSERLDSLSEAVSGIHRLDREQVAVIQYATAQRRVDFLETQARQIESVVEQHANDFTPELGLPDNVGRTIQSVIGALVAHGADKGTLENEFKTIEAEVKGDAKYMVRDDEERLRFTGAMGGDPDNLKRQWHIREKQLKYLSRFIARKIESERGSSYQTAEAIRV